MPSLGPRSRSRMRMWVFPLPDHAWLYWFDEAEDAVVERLKEKGKLENALIIVTSDNGNYNYAKSTIYEGGIKVPLMM